jgi:hypothetical protein
MTIELAFKETQALAMLSINKHGCRGNTIHAKEFEKPKIKFLIHNAKRMKSNLLKQ